MLDGYNRNINYLRVSVTDRCNLRCTYCMPGEGIPLLSHNDILSFEEITGFVRTAVELGIDKVRITGGEPLVRKGIVELVGMLASIEGIRDLSMTTNGQLLQNFADPLKKAGLNRVNVSLDTMDPERFLTFTRIGSLNKTLEGIEAAKQAGLEPVKINCVVKKSRLEEDAREVEDYALKNGFQVRFIREMDLARGIFYRVDGGEGGKCITCNRIRLTATGDVKPCLFNPLAWNIREYGYRGALVRAVTNKPACGTVNKTGHFSNIGG
jgi:cyclic pyranopterin phosphate synthase